MHRAYVAWPRSYAQGNSSASFVALAVSYPRRLLRMTTNHHVAGQYVDGLWVESEGSGEPVLLLAGGPASSHLTFHPYFSALADQFRVLYVDYRGRGESTTAAEITFAGDVADIEALRTALGLEHLNI